MKMDHTLRVILMTKAWPEAVRMGLSPLQFAVCFRDLTLTLRGRIVWYGWSSTIHTVVEICGLEKYGYHRYQKMRINTAHDVFHHKGKNHRVLESQLAQLMSFLHVHVYASDYTTPSIPDTIEAVSDDEEYEDAHVCYECSQGSCADCKVFYVCHTDRLMEDHDDIAYDPEFPSYGP